MTLNEYLRREGLSDVEFGARCEPPLNRVEVWRLKKRIRNPRADKVAIIERATRNQVMAKDLLPAEVGKRRAA